MAKRKKSKKVLRIVLLALIVFIAFVVQNTWGMPNRIGRAVFFYLIPLIICIGLFESVAVSTWLGLFAGMLWDCVSAEIPGFHSIMLMCFGCFSALLINHLFRRNIITALLMGGVGTAFYCFLYWFLFLWLKGSPGAGSTFWAVYFPSIFLTAAVLPIIYLILRCISGRLTD